MDVNSRDCNAVGFSLGYAAQFFIYFAASVSILVILCFIQKRRRLCLNCCGSRPSLPVPMNFLIDPAYRFPYIMIFAVMAVHLFSTLRGVPLQSDNIYLSLFYRLVIIPFLVVVVIGVQYFPLLACVQSSHLFIGHCMGLLYSLLWFGFHLLDMVSLFLRAACYGHLESPRVVASLVFETIPIILIILAVVMWYLLRVIIDIITYCSHRKFIEPDAISHHLARVRNLLSGKPSGQVAHGRIISALLKVVFYFVPYQKYVRFPLPFLCVVVSIVAFTYQMSFAFVLIGSSLLEELVILRNDLLNGRNVSGDIEYGLNAVFIGVPAIFTIAPFLSLAVCSILILHMMVRISKTIKKTARKGFSEKLPSKVSRLRAAWKFLGLQMGLFIWAYIIYYLIAVAAGLFIIAIFLGFKYLLSYSIRTAVYIIVPIIWVKLVIYLQYLISKLVFFEDSSGKFISITNQRLFNWFSFVLFLYNGFTGFVGAILRIATTAIVSLLLLFRLDVVTVIHKFDKLDSGHKAFLSFFYLHYCYNNAVVHSFIYILSGLIDKRGEKYGPTQLKFYTISDKTKNRARNRWLLAYTLLKNPSIQSLRASAVKEMGKDTLSPVSDDSFSPWEEKKIRDEVVIVIPETVV